MIGIGYKGENYLCKVTRNPSKIKAPSDTDEAFYFY